MTFDYELTLIAETSSTNDIGDPIVTETETVVLCGQKSVGRNEHYMAMQNGLQLELVFVVHPYEYDKQPTVEFEGVRYKVDRTYKVDGESLELTCSGLVGV